MGYIGRWPKLKTWMLPALSAGRPASAASLYSWFSNGLHHFHYMPSVAHAAALLCCGIDTRDRKQASPWGAFRWAGSFSPLPATLEGAYRQTNRQRQTGITTYQTDQKDQTYCTYIYTHRQTETYIRTYMHPYLHPSIHPSIHPRTHTPILTCLHSYMHVSVHYFHIHTLVYMQT